LAVKLPKARLETNIFELVPWKAPNPAARAGAAALRGQVERRVLVLVGAADPGAAERAADAYAGVLKSLSGSSAVVCALPPEAATRALACFEPHSFGLLSMRDRALLRGSGAGSSSRSGDGSGLLRSAEEGLYLPSGFNGSLGFSRDPFGIFGRWLEENAALSGDLSLRDGHLETEGEGLTWVAVSAEADPDQAEGARRAFDAGLERAADAARAEGASGLLRTGFLFHEHVAAAQARREVGAVGLLSTGLLALLLWVAFRRGRPMLLALLPAAVGCVAGAAAVLLLWARVHAVALVFGSTVVGVADDYGLYFLSGLYDGAWDSARRGRSAFAPLGLAMATSVLGYAVLALLPIPGLKQVAVFACVGLAVDWAGVVLWYPRLTAGLKALPKARIAAARGLRRGWPRWGDAWLTWVLALAVLGAAAGCLRLRVDDDVRLLYAHDLGLDNEQAQAQALTGLGGVTGVFVVQAPTAQALLEREEALRDALAAAGSPPWTAVSDFVPSLARQASNRAALRRALFGPPHLAKRLAAALGQASWPDHLQRDLARHAAPLSPEAWLTDPVSLPWRYLWLPQADGSVESLVLPGPSLSQAESGRLAPLARSLPGVQYVDQLQAVGNVLGALRRLLAWMLAAGTLVVFALLVWRLRAAAFAAMIPTVIGALLALGALGWAGLPLNLFVLLALLLLLGTAVDFGIYMQDGGGRLSSFVAVQVAALTNIAAVGVLAFSGTPALRAFGLVLGVGALGAWLCAPCFGPMPKAASRG